MGFLLKCFLVFALFYILAHGDRRVAAPSPRVATARAARPAERRATPAPEDDFSATLRRAAVEKLAGVAREKCLSHPEDCAALLKAAGAGLAASGAGR